MIDTSKYIKRVIIDGVEIPIYNAILIATTDAEMETLLVQDNIGKIVQFTGTSSTYETNAYYLIGE